MRVQGPSAFDGGRDENFQRPPEAQELDRVHYQFHQVGTAFVRFQLRRLLRHRRRRIRFKP